LYLFGACLLLLLLLLLRLVWLQLLLIANTDVPIF
jgi:hypothetical protein